MSRLILELKGGRPVSRRVSEAELRELNKPAPTPKPGRYDADVQRYGSNFNQCNTVFGGK